MTSEDELDKIKTWKDAERLEREITRKFFKHSNKLSKILNK